MARRYVPERGDVVWLRFHPRSGRQTWLATLPGNIYEFEARVREAVAQVSNLLYRRYSMGSGWERSKAFGPSHGRRVGNPR